MTRRQSQLQNTKHEYVLDRLSSYMDGQLPADEQARVEAHLRTCDSCRDDLRTLRWTHDLLQEVVPVPIPRSFVIREADVARPKRTWIGGRPLATLQWATALVAILLILVVTGDVWIGARLVPGGAQPAVSIMGMQAATDKVTVTAEAEVIVTHPVQSESAAESARALATLIEPETKVSQDTETSGHPGEAMGGKGVPAGTPTGPAVPAESAPVDKEIVATAGPVFKGVDDKESESQPPPQPGEESPQLPTSVPQLGKQPADAAPVATQPPDWAERPATRFPWMQAGWRVAEIGLGVLLVGLVIAVVWVRRHKRT